MSTNLEVVYEIEIAFLESVSVCIMDLQLAVFLPDDYY